MYFKINKKTFLDNINIVSRAVSMNSPLPVLHNIKLSVKDNYIQMTASDGDISIQTSIFIDESSNLTIFEEGDVLLDGKYLSDMIRKIDAEIVEVETIDGCLTSIRGLQVNFELNGIKSENYPVIDFSQPAESFELEAEVLKNIIYQTCFATSDKETRPVLTGVNFNCSGNVLTCVATDSYRLAQKRIVLENNHNFNITIPSKSLQDVSRIINTDNDITISLSDKKVLFIINNILVQTRLIDGLYPETSRLIPSEFNYELLVDARDLLNALDRASFIKNEGIYLVRMEMSEDEIVITSRSNDVVSVERVTPIEYIGEPLNISFKGNYVYDAIRVLNAFQVKISFSGNMKPFILKSVDDENVLQLVLPIKTYN